MLQAVSARVTANFSKSGPKNLKFCTSELVECLHRMRPKKSSRIFHAYAKRDFLITQKPHPQISPKKMRFFKMTSVTPGTRIGYTNRSFFRKIFIEKNFY